MVILPKLLRKTSDGRIFGYTEGLAKRSDMSPVWPKGVNPNIGEVPDDKTIVESKDGQLRQVIVEKDKQILGMQKQIDDLYSVNVELNEENTKLNNALDVPPADAAGAEVVGLVTEHGHTETGDHPGTHSQADSVSDSVDRQKLITDTVKTMKEERAEFDFTSQDKPRIESIEARCGLVDVTGEERDAADAATS